MPKFANQFEPHARIHTNPGTPEKVLYGPVFDENTSWALRIVR